MGKAFALVLAVVVAASSATAARRQTGAGDVAFSGELRQWHTVTLTFAGPQADEASAAPNPFLDYRLSVTFSHESGSPAYTVPGYFAADGNAANSSATAGNKWRVHLTPGKTGRWTYRISFITGKGVALASGAAGQPVMPLHGRTGTIQIAATDKRAPDFRARGRLQYAGAHYLRFAGSGEYFLKLGADSPAGTEYYFGYALPDNDLVLENFRSRDRSWDYGRIALEFFHARNLPFWQMVNADELVDNARHDNSRYCFAKPDEVYLVYLPSGGAKDLDLSTAGGAFTVRWFDPRNGGPLRTGSVSAVNGGGTVALGRPPDQPSEDWLAVVAK